jgi:hypothetical protein
MAPPRPPVVGIQRLDRPLMSFDADWLRNCTRDKHSQFIRSQSYVIPRTSLATVRKKRQVPSREGFGLIEPPFPAGESHMA